jgi:DNA polymerase V
MLHFVSEYDPSTEGFEASFKIDLNAELIHHPNSTYLMQVDSSELIGSHIAQGDIVVVDRALTPKSGHLIVAYLNGEKLIRYYSKTKSIITLSNSLVDSQHTYTLEPKDLFEIFGVVTNLLRCIQQ